jgi:hypothetical protein
VGNLRIRNRQHLVIDMPTVEVLPPVFAQSAPTIGVSRSRATAQTSGLMEFQLDAGTVKELQIRLPAMCSATVPQAPVCLEVGLYSPIQRLVDRQTAEAAYKCLPPFAKCASVPITMQRQEGATCLMDTDSSQATRMWNSNPSDFTPTLLDEDETMCTSLVEHIGESAGADGDAYRFRYDFVSTEEGYSPIAALRPCSRSLELDRKHVWLSHVDGDGAICSKAIPGPLKLSIDVPEQSRVDVQACSILLAGVQLLSGQSATTLAMVT